MNGHSWFKQQRSYVIVTVLVLPILHSGCSTSDDPREGGFVSGVVGLTSGGYQKRITDREQSYQAETRQQQRLMTEAEALRQEQLRIESQLNLASRRLVTLERKLREERAAISQERQTTSSAQQKFRRLETTEARVTQVKDKLHEARRGERAMPELAAQTTEIHRDIDEIDALVELVSGSRL